MNNIKIHLTFAIVCFFRWLFFLLIGLPSYYVDWQFESKILSILITVSAFLPILSFIVLRHLEGDYLKNSFIFAFYASIEVFVLDVIYCGIVQELGFSFSKTHWVQVIGYFIVWIEIPYIGYLMKKWIK